MSIHRNQIFLLVLIFSAFSSYKAAFTCDPTSDCESANFGNKVPDPDDCHNYYLCINSEGNSVPSDAPIPCPGGQYFDQSLANCKTETGTCNNACNKICKTACQETFDVIPDPSQDCSHYFICLADGPTPTACSDPTPYFDGTGCSANVYDCCDSCVPYCFTAFTQVQDPLDCHKYYLCTAANMPPGESNHFNCTTGEGFNAESGVCEPESDDCEDYCPSTTTDSSLIFG